MNLTPAQSLLARAAARRIVRSQIAVLLDGSRPERITLDYDQAQCLLVAAADTLGLDRDALDLGPYTGPDMLPVGGPNIDPAPAELAWHHPT